jgi:hypothetical protein
MIKSIEPRDAEDSNPLAVGKTLHAVMFDMDLEIEIKVQFLHRLLVNSTSLINHQQNSPECFEWQGPPVYGFRGLHGFLFTPSTVPGNEGGTTLVQQQSFMGPTASLMQPWLGGRTLVVGFTKFNEDLKKSVEGAKESEEER